MERKQKDESSSPSSAKRSRGKRLTKDVKKFVTGQLIRLANEQSNPEQPSGSRHFLAGDQGTGAPIGQLGQFGSSFAGRGGQFSGSLVGQLGSSLAGQSGEPTGSPVGQLGSSLARQSEVQAGSPVGQLGSSLAGQLGGHENEQGDSLAGQLGGSLARRLGKKKKGGSSLMGQIGGSLMGQLGEQGNPGGALAGQLGSSLIGQLGGRQQGGSLAGQLGSSLLGQLGGGQQGGSLAGQLGSSLLGQLGGGQQGGSLAGQLGSSLIGQLGGGQQGGSLAGQLGSSLLGQLGGGQQGGSLAGQLGSSLLGQLGGGQQGGSLAGQLGGSLLGQLGGGQQGGSLFGQLGGFAGGGGGQRPPAAGGAQPESPAGANPVLSTVACSAFQGLRRAAEAKSIPMKVFWILMVLISVGMFIKGALNLTNKVRTVQVVRTYQMDKVPFVFPDLYFCPKNSYSGSFPYTLNQSQADVVNKEVERLSRLFDEQYATSGLDESSKTKVWSIQQSLPARLLKDHIMHRPKQSLFYTPMISNYGDVDYEAKILPGSIICFKMALTEPDRKVLIRRQNQETLRLALFTDPAFPDFNYTGEQIRPIFNLMTNETIPFRLWYPSGVVKTIASGYTLLIVPRGVYPSMEHESTFLLAPGKSYDIDIHMEEHKYSHELWDSHCSPALKSAEFADQLTGQRVEYNYSYDACYYTEFARHLHKVGGYVQQGFPIIWNLRDSPRWGNLSENVRINRSTIDYGMDLTKAYEIGDPVRVCDRQQPCVQQKYVASFSFHNWPNIGGSYSAAFQQTDPVEQPAIHQLARIAQQLDAGIHSTHSEAALRHFIAESMLEVSIRVDSPLASRVLMTASYSSTSYLSDIGGLMGLYLGCSVLTLCEFAEMLYAKATAAVQAKCCRGKGSGDDNGVEEEGKEAEDSSKPEDAAEMMPLKSDDVEVDSAGIAANEAVV